MDIKKFQSFMILLEGLSGNFLCIYSVAKEPNLEEWTCRAESSDLLYEPVGSNPKLIYIFIKTLSLKTHTGIRQN